MKFVPVDIETFLKYRERFATRRHLLTPAEELESPFALTAPTFYLAKDDAGHGGFVACGYALDTDGELLSLFNAAGKGMGYGDEAIKDAVRNGAKYLTCFDGWLADFWAGQGWEKTRSEPFDPHLAPPLWVEEIDGQPDVLTFDITERRRREILEAVEAEPEAVVPIEEYDDFDDYPAEEPRIDLLTACINGALEEEDEADDGDPRVLESSPQPSLKDLLLKAYPKDEVVYSTPSLLERAAMTDVLRQDLVHLHIQEHRRNGFCVSTVGGTVYERSAALIQKRRLEAESPSVEVALVPLTVRCIQV